MELCREVGKTFKAVAQSGVAVVSSEAIVLVRQCLAPFVAASTFSY